MNAEDNIATGCIAGDLALQACYKLLEIETFANLCDYCQGQHSADSQCPVAMAQCAVDTWENRGPKQGMKK